MYKRILAYCFLVLGILTITFFRRYSGHVIPYPILFWLLGLIMFFIAFLFLRKTPSIKEININKRLTNMIEEIMEKGEKIKVDLSSCEVKEHSYFEQKERYGTASELLTLDIEREIQSINAVKPNSNLDEVQIKQSVIIFINQNSVDGKEEKYVSRVIPMDKVTLSFYLEQQRETTIYVDQNNKSIYYFDLSFLTD